ncbi:MAG TPA: L,D-transpeptidase family protein [Chitinophagaceae bacterium]
MKNWYWNKIKLLIIGCVSGMTAFSQITPERLLQFLSDEKNSSNKEAKDFYTRLNYNTAWIQKENLHNRDILLNTLGSSASLGLAESDYPVRYIDSLNNGTLHLLNSYDSLMAEIRVTDAAIHFYKDFGYGNTKPSFGYNGLKYFPDCRNLPVLLADFISNNKLPLLVTELSLPFPEIILLEQKINWFYTVMADSNFHEEIIRSAQVNQNNKPLVSKLHQLGIIIFPDFKISDSLLKVKVKEAQRQFNLLADGVLRSTTLQELNIPLSARMKQLRFSVNYYRWLHCLIKNQSVIVVNIPAAYLKVYRDNKVILEMRIIVGKQSTPTPTLASSVTEVILYPYWHVPYSIATKELLPAIKRNPGYIDAGNYQVLNGSGKIMDPYSVNWNEFSTGYFPYIIRQSTGCDNSLGLLKLNFYSPFGVYLHDTPKKGLFGLNKRFFSHGCMRMQKPMDLGHLVLQNNVIAIDTLEQKGCLRNQSPITVKTDENMPVIVWYNPAGTDSTGRVLFYEDVYRKFDWMKRK